MDFIGGKPNHSDTLQHKIIEEEFVLFTKKPLKSIED